MKAIIEHFVEIDLESDNKSFQSAMIELNIILTLIASSGNEFELRKNMTTSRFKMFEFGFGANHFWCHQKKSDGTVFPKRLIFIDFS